jgi:hypothetical protein
MGRLARQLDSDRAARNAARSTFDTRLAGIRQDLDARGIGGRIADRIGEDARKIMEEAVEIAGNSRGIIAGTIAAVALWIFHKPVIAWMLTLLDKEEEADDDRD